MALVVWRPADRNMLPRLTSHLQLQLRKRSASERMGYFRLHYIRLVLTTEYFAHFDQSIKCILKFTYDSTNTNLNLRSILETITNASTIPPPPYSPHLPQQCLKIV